MKRLFPAACVILLFASAFAFGQEPPAGPPKLPAEMSNLQYFAGTWSCSGDSPAGPFGAAHKTQSTLTLKRDLDGFWYDGMMTEMKTASNPHPVRGMLHLGYESASKQYVQVWLDNTGGWSTEMSPGWEGDTMTFTGDQVVMGKKGTAKDTITKKGNNQFTHKFELTMDGQTSTVVDETCKKAK